MEQNQAKFLHFTAACQCIYGLSWEYVPSYIGSDQCLHPESLIRVCSLPRMSVHTASNKKLILHNEVCKSESMLGAYVAGEYSEDHISPFWAAFWEHARRDPDGPVHLSSLSRDFVVYCIDSQGSIHAFCQQWRLWSGCMDWQAVLSPHGSFMSKGTFCHDAAIWYWYSLQLPCG